MIGKGYPDRYLTEDETGSIVDKSLHTLPLDGKRVLVPFTNLITLKNKD